MLITGKTLFTFVDPKDPFMPLPVAGEEQSGPVLSILSTRHFDFLFFFFTHTRSNAELTRQEVSHRYPECQVRLHEILVSDPKDYSALMGKLAREVRDFVRASRSADNRVCVSSGTAEMRAAWFLLLKLWDARSQKACKELVEREDSHEATFYLADGIYCVSGENPATDPKRWLRIRNNKSEWCNYREVAHLLPAR